MPARGGRRPWSPPRSSRTADELSGGAPTRSFQINTGPGHTADCAFTTRLRIVNTTLRRSGIRIALLRDSVRVPWRVVAREGADVPEAQRVARASREIVSIGQTVDVEITPDAPGDLRLLVFKGPQPNAPLLGIQPLRVRGAP